MNLLIFNLKTDADDTVLGFTTDWINALARHFSKVTVITMAVGRVSVAGNVEVMSVGKEKGWSEARRAAKFYALLGRVLSTRRYHACFAHMMPLFAVMGWPLLQLKRVPITLWYAHGHVPPFLRVAVHLVDRVVTSSRSGFRIETDKLVVVGQGIDTDRFAPSPRPEKDVLLALTLGRIAPVKRLEVAIEALALLPHGLREKVRLRFVGDTLRTEDQDYLMGLNRLVRERGLSRQVEFQAGVPFAEAPGVYAKADLFVNSSDTDSVDKTVLEAMSSGLPIVTSNAAFKEVLPLDLARDWIVPKGDPRALAQRLEHLVSLSAGEREDIGVRLRETVTAGHSLPRLAKRLALLMSEKDSRGTTITTSTGAI
ncbi:glycosyltransferase family 4 protein [Geomonas subterranea]|uniref:Glycosyltransferase family 4 protein n=1 Tax=Geomonas subterranea TaxID=2847989 RepID=A0ABX8LLP6_9BACT|nr:glycosyltransferase family 4 protein [Geomonas subterranea]QXE91559.1 glycosyltransferase family 4 protein [Geomonas subterranea]QXM10352.1 glycosyltransferase family 4 protein [Geomonas subterranea]